jgi:uncharacterized membrane protein HdeD (DUF308 family)
VTQYWFKPKRYGYGATPATWQGWVVTLATALLIAGINVGLVLTARNYWTLAALLGVDLLTVGFLVILTRLKTEGEWRWRWGDAD